MFVCFQPLSKFKRSSYLLSMLFILSYHSHSILLFTHDYPSVCLGDVPCVVRNVLFAGTSFHRQSIFIRAFYEPLWSLWFIQARDSTPFQLWKETQAWHVLRDPVEWWLGILDCFSAWGQCQMLFDFRYLPCKSLLQDHLGPCGKEASN